MLHYVLLGARVFSHNVHVILLASTVALCIQSPMWAADRDDLKTDPRLQLTLTLKSSNPRVTDLLRELRRTTGLEIAPDDTQRHDAPAFASVNWHNLPAWAAMQRIAKSEAVDGLWKETPNGYRLVARVTTDDVAKSSSPAVIDLRGSAIWSAIILGSLLVVLLSAIAWRAVRSTRSQKATN